MIDIDLTKIGLLRSHPGFL